MLKNTTNRDWWCLWKKGRRGTERTCVVVAVNSSPTTPKRSRAGRRNVVSVLDWTCGCGKVGGCQFKTAGWTDHMIYRKALANTTLQKHVAIPCYELAVSSKPWGHSRQSEGGKWGCCRLLPALLLWGKRGRKGGRKDALSSHGGRHRRRGYQRREALRGWYDIAAQ